jgi:hypothetical protein
MNNTIAYGSGLKRAYQSDEPQASQAYQSNSTATNSPPLSSASATSAFRNVSACNRCRVRKNRCDQNLPACTACAKANVKCVGYDPITKREIPRSYVYYLESRLAYFESILIANGIQFNQPEAFDADSRGGNDALQSPRSEHPSEGHGETQVERSQQRHNDEGWSRKQEDADKLDNLVSSICCGEELGIYKQFRKEWHETKQALRQYQQSRWKLHERLLFWTSDQADHQTSSVS